MWVNHPVGRRRGEVSIHVDVGASMSILEFTSAAVCYLGGAITRSIGTRSGRHSVTAAIPATFRLLSGRLNSYLLSGKRCWLA